MNSLEPGFVVVQGNRLEALRDLVFAWIERHPLEPLEEEVLLVQSNGAADWLKIARAEASGICAAVRIELPGRFLWRMYRRILGSDHIATQSALDRDALTWRLMATLPQLVGRPTFVPVARFLADGDPERRLQLARRLADVFDQYQVYRGDWLADWERKRFVLADARGQSRPLPDDQRWQAELWRVLVEGLDAREARSLRPRVHRDALDALAEGRCAEPLPRRVVLFGASHVSSDGLAAFAALAARMQVLVALQNPCRYHWSDILDGREALSTASMRLPARADTDLSRVPLEAMHLHAHPLLAAWGRQGRDVMRQLDAFDDVAAQARLDVPRVDVFDDGPGATLLAQVQARIRDLVPDDPSSRTAIANDDRSIVFQVAHGPQREIEILHDQLLGMLADAKGTLRPRDIVVMVPDIDAFAPAVRAVFGQHPRSDARRVPFEIADLKSRGSDPLLVALEWLLRLPTERVRLHELRDLLDVPAAAAAADVSDEALPRLFGWLAGAGVRWGLDATHRTQLGLGEVGEQNTWAFGFRRLLAGYASGDAPAFGGAVPYPEVGGLDAADVGAMIALVERLDAWRTDASTPAPPRAWGERCRALVDALFLASDERERLTIAALHSALAAWLAACDAAHFVEPVPLAIVREGWLAGIDALDANRRFASGGVTFCTLMPLRAIPFEVVCLLGMNDGDFPRTARASDFDLMALPGQARPGDRSRRDDDRYLMLEALLSARRTLYVSWRGRNPRTNASEPPSVLVAQLRDHLERGWFGPDGGSVLAALTTEHPMQGFSRRYFERGGPPSHAREWRRLHEKVDARRRSKPSAFEPLREPVAIAQLVRFVRRPLDEYFRMRLAIGRGEEAEAIDDDEPFTLAGLASWALRDRLVARPNDTVRAGIADAIAARVERERAAGDLPLFATGDRVVAQAAATAGLALARWRDARERLPLAVARLPVRFENEQLVVDDWLDGLRGDGATVARIDLSASKVLTKKGELRRDRLIAPWIAMLVARANGIALRSIAVGCDAVVTLEPIAEDEARVALAALSSFWEAGLAAPLPVAAKTALAYGHERDEKRARTTYDGSFNGPPGEASEFASARLYARFDDLVADGSFFDWADLVYAPIAQWSAGGSIERFDAEADEGEEADA